MGCGDGEYVGIFENILRPVALEFDPELILVSAGFDTLTGDPLGGMNVTPKGFAGLTRSIMETAKSCCEGKMVITLEGGYHVEGQRDAVREVLKEMSGLSETPIEAFRDITDQQFLKQLTDRVRQVHHPYWKNL